MAEQMIVVHIVDLDILEFSHLDVFSVLLIINILNDLLRKIESVNVHIISVELPAEDP